jgi:hypothetical protein
LEQELSTLLEHPSSPPVFSRVRLSQSFVVIGKQEKFEDTIRGNQKPKSKKVKKGQWYKQ